MILVDTGPLVALMSKRDAHHSWAIAAFAAETEPLITCEAVITESCHLVGKARGAGERILLAVANGSLEVVSMSEDADVLAKLFAKYRNVPASYADVCLVRLSERFAKSRLITTDRDFLTYRKNGRQVIPLIAPFS